MRCRVSVVPGSEVSVEGGDDCVLLPLFNITPECKHSSLLTKSGNKNTLNWRRKQSECLQLVKMLHFTVPRRFF